MSRGIYDEDDERFTAGKYELRDLLIGVILFLFGGFLLLKNISVYSFGFARWFGDTSGGIMIVVFIACFMVMVIRTNFLTKTLCLLSVIAIIINVILGTHLVFKHISAAELLVMCMLFFGGLAFILKVLFMPKIKKSRQNKQQAAEKADNTDDIYEELEEIKKQYR